MGIICRRRIPRINKIVKCPGQFDSLSPKILSDFNGNSSSGFKIIQSTLVNFMPKHLLKADRLSTKLNFIARIILWLTMLILYRNDFPIRIEFHSISLSCNTKQTRSNFQITFSPHDTTRLSYSAMDFFVQNTTRGGKEIFRPELFDMYERALPRAKANVLQATQQEVIRFGIHQTFTMVFVSARGVPSSVIT